MMYNLDLQLLDEKIVQYFSHKGKKFFFIQL